MNGTGYGANILDKGYRGGGIGAVSATYKSRANATTRKSGLGPRRHVATARPARFLRSPRFSTRFPSKQVGTFAVRGPPRTPAQADSPSELGRRPRPARSC